MAKSSRKQTEWSEKAAALLHEGVINIRTVQFCRAEGQMVQKFAAVLQGGQIHGIYVYFWSGFFEGLFFWVLYIFYMIGLCLGAFEVYHGRCTLGEVLICSNSLLIGYATVLFIIQGRFFQCLFPWSHGAACHVHSQSKSCRRDCVRPDRTSLKGTRE